MSRENAACRRQALRQCPGQHATWPRQLQRQLTIVLMNNFAQWLAQTQVSIAIQSHLWIIPAVQSVHIVAIGIVMGSVFMIDLRIWGFTGRDRTLHCLLYTSPSPRDS